MRVLLLAAGVGSRLKPITETIPKCLVPIGGKPLLLIWLEKLSHAGFGPFLINTHWLNVQVEEFINKSNFKDQVSLVYEPELLGTAGTLAANIDFFQGDDGLVLHADNYCEADLRAFQNAHEQRPNSTEATMMTFRTVDPHSCGIVEVDGDGIIIGFHEKVKYPPSNLANGAVYILSSSILETLRHLNRPLVDFSTDIIPLFYDKFYTHEIRELFADIGQVKIYKKFIHHNVNCL